jgi:hypothetical protein
MADRYLDLLNDLPVGRYYERKRPILPFRDTPYEFRFGPVEANRTYGVFLNGVFQTVVTTDVEGIAVVELALVQGDNDIDLFLVSSSGFAEGAIRNNLVPNGALSLTVGAPLTSIV